MSNNIHADNPLTLLDKTNHELQSGLEWTKASKITANPKRSSAVTIAVGGGGAGGAVAPPFGSKRRKSSKIRANGLFIWANSLDIWAHHCQNTVSDSVKTIFFFFFYRKTVQISGKTFFFFFLWRTPSFGQKNRSNFGKDLFFFFFFFFWRTPSFGQKNRSNFGKDLFFFFFFGEHLHLDRKTVQISGKTFFFFFFFFLLENTSIWAEKTVSILTEKRNASSHFSGKSLLPPQIILSSYGHGGNIAPP